MGTVTVIAATRRPDARLPEQPARPLRVCAYCRVSTDSEEQETSYAAQCAHYGSYIRSNPCWTLAGIFADEGISGTSTRGRDEFNRMIRACEGGEIDMIITKSISRFARNTLDCLTYIRRLKELRIPVVFEKENINTLDASGEVLLTILASIAQQESASISRNVRMGIEYGFQQGRGRLNYNAFLGYTGGDGPGSLVIVPEEAETVRRIFREYLEGRSPHTIAARLAREGVPTATGAGQWYASTVARMLGNEKYCGDLLMQKYYVEDYLTHRVVRNDGARPKYFVEDDHEPIVPKAIFRLAQAERARRAALDPDPSTLRFAERLTLNGRLFCGSCGRPLRRCHRPGTAQVVWLCRGRTGESAGASRDCASRAVRETEAQAAVVRALNALPERACSLRRELAELTREQPPAIENASPVAPLDTLAAGSDPLIAPLDTPAVGATLCGRPQPCADAQTEREMRLFQLRLLLELADDLTEARNRPHHAAPDDPNPTVPPAACRDAEDFLRRTRRPLPPGLLNAQGDLAVYDNDLVIRSIDRVTVRETGFEVRFKTGLRVNTGGA